MNIKRILVLLIIIGVIVVSCKKDDENTPETAPPRLLSEVQVENDSTLIAFLKNNTYNYKEFESPSEGFNFKIKFSPLEGDNANDDPIFERPGAVAFQRWGNLLIRPRFGAKEQQPQPVGVKALHLRLIVG